jgi:hypothetical protein
MAGDESRLLTLLRTTLKQKVDMRRQLAMRGSPRDLHKKYGQISDAVGVRSMRGRPPRLRDGLCLRAVYWSYIEPKHQELTVDLRSPLWDLLAHLLDQITQITIDVRSPCAIPRFAAPESSPPDAPAESFQASPPEPNRVARDTVRGSARRNAILS